MDEIERPDGISRRRMLKRVGAGAAIAWAAPVLTSLRMPAFAQAVSTNCPSGCGPDTCFGQTPCSDTGCFNVCQVSGAGCFCHQSSSCQDLQACTTTADCTNVPNSVCAFSCCGTLLCLPPCGVIVGGGAGPRTTP